MTFPWLSSFGQLALLQAFQRLYKTHIEGSSENFQLEGNYYPPSLSIYALWE